MSGIATPDDDTIRDRVNAAWEAYFAAHRSPEESRQRAIEASRQWLREAETRMADYWSRRVEEEAAAYVRHRDLPGLLDLSTDEPASIIRALTLKLRALNTRVDVAGQYDPNRAVRLRGAILAETDAQRQHVTPTCAAGFTDALRGIAAAGRPEIARSYEEAAE